MLLGVMMGNSLLLLLAKAGRARTAGKAKFDFFCFLFLKITDMKIIILILRGWAAQAILSQGQDHGCGTFQQKMKPQPRSHPTGGPPHCQGLGAPRGHEGEQARNKKQRSEQNRCANIPKFAKITTIGLLNILFFFFKLLLFSQKNLILHI